MSMPECNSSSEHIHYVQTQVFKQCMSLAQVLKDNLLSAAICMSTGSLQDVKPICVL